MTRLIYLWAFLCGGIICSVAQIFIDKTKLTPARILVGCVVLGVFLSAIGIYEPFVNFAGAGATVPLTGFGHTLAKGVKEAINEDTEQTDRKSRLVHAKASMHLCRTRNKRGDQKSRRNSEY